jgi:hypothetical protein
METCSIEIVDLLKIDIEGSEEPLFLVGAEKWLGFVRNLCIEFHGENCERTVLKALSQFDYDESRSGEYALFLNLRPKPQPQRGNPSFAHAISGNRDAL